MLKWLYNAPKHVSIGIFKSLIEEFVDAVAYIKIS